LKGTAYSRAAKLPQNEAASAAGEAFSD